MNLEFRGRICNGAGLFAQEIILPSPVEELKSIENWPSRLINGTLNVQIGLFGWPSATGLNFRSGGVQCLDRAMHFPPALYLHHSYIPNNTIRPTKEDNSAGDLQFWRTELFIEGVREIVRCYMLRRVRSGYQNTIEIMSHIHFRNEYDVRNGQKVSLIVYPGAATQNEIHMRAG